MDKLTTDPTTLTDEALLRAHQETDGEPGDPVVEARVAELQRRGLDI